MKKSSLLTLMILLANTYCMANVLHVTTGQDSVPGSLRTAVSMANPGDIIEIDEDVPLLTLEDGEIVIQKSLTLRGAAKNSRPAIDAQNKSRILEIAGSNLKVNISNINFTHGKATLTKFITLSFPEAPGGAMAIHTEGSKVEISDADFYQNNAAGHGGAIIATGPAAPRPTWVILNRVNFHDNKSGLGGGAIFHWGTSVKAIDSTLSNNTAIDGGAIWTSTGCLDLRNSSITENHSSRRGGINSETSYMRLDNVLMKNNSSQEYSDIDGGLILKMQNSQIQSLARPLALVSQGNNQIDNYTAPEYSYFFVLFHPTDRVGQVDNAESLNLQKNALSALGPCVAEMMK